MFRRGKAAPLELLKMGHPLLRQRSAPFEAREITERTTRKQVDRMLATMQDFGGEDSVSAGLAAPQVGWMKRLVILDAPLSQVPRTVCFNPELSVVDESPILMEESCMSVPGLVAPVVRARSVSVSYVDSDGCQRSFTASGWCAGLVQHELDHLDGILLVDRVKSTNLHFIEPYFEYVQPHIASKLVQDGDMVFDKTT